MSEFDTTIVAAVTGHMNGDHPEDNLLIARAFGYPEASESSMTGLDGEAGVWQVADPSGRHELRVAWPGGAISDRPAIRREVVALYRAACAALGVTPREEEEAPQHPHAAQGGAHPHAGGHPHGAEADDSFSGELRRATWGEHESSEHSTFMEDIMRGRATRDDYAALVAQHYFMYVALEAAAEKFTQDPAYTGFHPAALVRLPSLEADLEHLMGEGWRDRIAPVPAVAAYAARIREVADQGWLPGILAHHYTRYLGDLSGGQAIARVVARQHDLDEAGVAFYAFPELGDLRAFKTAYRDGLDALGTDLDEAERQRVVDEVREAYRFNTETFIDLDKARAAAV